MRTAAPAYIIGLVMGITIGFLVNVVVPGPLLNPPSIPGVQKITGSVGQVVVTPTAGPAPTPLGDVRKKKVAIVTDWLHTVSRLETQEYHVTGDTMLERKPWMGAINGESIQVHTSGSVVGRTDLSAMLQAIDQDLKNGAVVVSADGKTVDFVLPWPEVSRPSLDRDGGLSFPGYQYTLFSTPDPTLWQNAIEDGQDQLVEQACEQGIDKRAAAETARQLQVLFSLAFDTVNVRTQQATTCGQS